MVQTRSAKHAALAAAAPAPFQLLHELPSDLQLRIASLLDDPRHRASLCLALPPVGLLAVRESPLYKELPTKVGMEIVLGRAVNGAMMRRYMLDKRSDYDGIVWLNRLAVSMGAAVAIRVEPRTPNDLVDPTSLRWTLVGRSGRAGGVLRAAFSDTDGVVDYAGAKGAERRVRMVSGCGFSVHYEGAKGAERQVMMVDGRSGLVIHYEGAKGAERQVMLVVGSSGQVIHFEGVKDAERKVRMELADGVVVYFEGEKGDEALVRAEYPDGLILPMSKSDLPLEDSEDDSLICH